jgi:hypothetical protein
VEPHIQRPVREVAPGHVTICNSYVMRGNGTALVQDPLDGIAAAAVGGLLRSSMCH